MITLAKNMGQLRFSQVAQLYEAEALEAEQALYAFLREDFFPGGICCLWEEKGRYVAVLRLQPWKDGWLLDGLQTHRDHWRKGYASEAAAACIRVAFEQFGFPAVYSYMNAKNEPSFRTAMKNGMTLVDEYTDDHHGPLKVYRITREEWDARG